MNVLYCGDRNIESGLIISILSLLKNAKTNLKVYVLTINSKDYLQMRYLSFQIKFYI